MVESFMVEVETLLAESNFNGAVLYLKTIKERDQYIPDLLKKEKKGAENK